MMEARNRTIAVITPGRLLTPPPLSTPGHIVMTDASTIAAMGI